MRYQLPTTLNRSEHSGASASASATSPSRLVSLSSYSLMGLGLWLVMEQGLLPGLICACLGFLLTRTLSRWLQALPINSRWAQILAASCVALAPLLLLSGALSQTREYVVDAPQQYRELLNFLAQTVLTLGQKLPPDLAAQLPQGAEGVQRAIASYLGTKAGMLASAGKAWLAGLLHAYVGLLIGLLAAVRPRIEPRAALALVLRQRAIFFGEAFRQIVAAQFWIAVFNTTLTALFLLFILPLWQMPLPYTPALIGLTFIAGLIPIIGNLFCNLVITLVGLSVSPMAAAVCLGFLVLIHKAEYIINARVVGQRTHIAIWELLTVMFIAESVFGPAGLVAAPLFYAYLKKELEVGHLL